MQTVSTENLQKIKVDSLRTDFASLHDARVLRVLSFVVFGLYGLRSFIALLAGEGRLALLVLLCSFAYLLLPRLNKAIKRTKLLSHGFVAWTFAIEFFLAFYGSTHFTQFMMVIPVMITFLALMNGMLASFLWGGASLLASTFLVISAHRANQFWPQVIQGDFFRYRFLLFLIGTELLLVFIIFLFQDVLAKHEQDAQLVRSDEAKATRRLAVAETIGKAAHELNNPLAIVDGAFRRLKHYQRSGDATQEAKNVLYIQDSVRRLREVLESIRIFVEGDLEESFSAVRVDEIVDRFALSSQEKLKSFGATLLVQNTLLAKTKVRCRPSQVQYVLQVLLENGIEASRKADKRLKLLTRVRGDMIRFELEDNGRGISAADRDKIFNPFFSTKAFGKSMGMNLSICHVLVGEQGGSMGFESMVEGGTRFFFELPKGLTEAEGGDV